MQFVVSLVQQVLAQSRIYELRAELTVICTFKCIAVAVLLMWQKDFQPLFPVPSRLRFRGGAVTLSFDVGASKYAFNVPQLYVLAWLLYVLILFHLSEFYHLHLTRATTPLKQCWARRTERIHYGVFFYLKTPNNR